MENTRDVFIPPAGSKINTAILQKMEDIFDFSTAKEYRETLIEIYHMYIINEHHSLPPNFDKMAGNMLFLIEFFKVVGEEME